MNIRKLALTGAAAIAAATVLFGGYTLVASAQNSTVIPFPPPFPVDKPKTRWFNAGVVPGSASSAPAAYFIDNSGTYVSVCTSLTILPPAAPPTTPPSCVSTLIQ